MKITVQEAVSAYREHALSLGLTPGYVKTTMSYLNRFAGCCNRAAREAGQRGPLAVDRLTPQHVSKFYQSLPNTRASHNRALSALKVFADYLERMKYLDPGEAQWLLGDRKSKRFARKPKYYIPVEQFRPMLDAAEADRHPADRMALALAFYTLARKSEIAGIQLKHLDMDRKILRVYRGKRKRWTETTMSPELWDELWRWLALYAAEMELPGPLEMIELYPDWHLTPRVQAIKRHGPHGAFDASLTTWRISPDLPANRLEYLVKRMLDIFGAQTEDGRKVRHLGEGAHTVRRSGARAMIDYLATRFGEDKALLMVSTMLDHENTAMTLLYIGRNIEQKRLNTWLETNSMYGPAPVGQAPNVTQLPLRGARSAAEPLSSSSGTRATLGEVDAL